MLSQEQGRIGKEEEKRRGVGRWIRRRTPVASREEGALVYSSLKTWRREESWVLGSVGGGVEQVAPRWHQRGSARPGRRRWIWAKIGVSDGWLGIRLEERKKEEEREKRKRRRGGYEFWSGRWFHHSAGSREGVGRVFSWEEKRRRRERRRGRRRRERREETEKKRKEIGR